jgi:hypothetical protein
MKSTLVLAVSLAAIGLGGCLTTGGSSDTPTTALRAHQPGDAKMTCEELTTEIAQMDQIIQEAKDAQATAQMTGQGIGVAQSAVPHVGGGAGMFRVLQGASMLTSATAQSGQSAAERAQQAELRRTSLVGIYQGKEC